MQWKKFLLLAIFFSTVGVSLAQAQHEFEVTPFGGTRFGGTIDESSTNYTQVDIKSSFDYGFLLDYTLFPSLQAEFMFNRQPTELIGVNTSYDTSGNLTSGNLDEYEWGFDYMFLPNESKLRPFVTAGLGFTHYGSNSLLYFSNRFSYNVGGGVKYFLTDHVGLRMEVRWSPSHTTSGQSVYCDEFYGCYQATATNKAEQGQANLGVILRF